MSESEVGVLLLTLVNHIIALCSLCCLTVSFYLAVS